VTPAATKMGIYHCPYSTALEKGLPWYILYFKKKLIKRSIVYIVRIQPEKESNE
jgi:hypothetical protein